MQVRTFALTIVLLCPWLLLPSASAHEYSAAIKARKLTEVDKAVAAPLAQEPGNADALIARAELILLEGNESRLDEAADFATRCIAAHPERSDCHETLGNVLGRKASAGGLLSAMGYATKIRDAFQRALELDPANHRARFSLLQYYLLAPGIVGGGKGKAQALASDTQKTQPQAAVLLQAYVDLADDKYAQAEKQALAAQTTGSDALADIQRGVLVGIATGLAQEKQYADSDRLFKQVAQRFPQNEAGVFGLARNQQEQGQLREALALFEQAQVIEPRAQGHYRIGQCLQGLGDKARAAAAFERALAFKPELRKKLKSDAQDQLKALRG